MSVILKDMDEAAVAALDPSMYKLLKKLEPVDFDKLHNGDMEQFEDTMDLDFEYFLTKITGTIAKLDEHGIVETDGKGNPIMVPDPDAVNSPRRIPGRYKAMRMLVWLFNKKKHPNLQMRELEELSVGHLVRLTFNPPEKDDREEAKNDPFTETSSEGT